MFVSSGKDKRIKLWQVRMYGTNWPQVKRVLHVPRVCWRVRVHMFLRVTCTLVWLRVVPLNYMRALLLHKCRSINSLC